MPAWTQEQREASSARSKERHRLKREAAAAAREDPPPVPSEGEIVEDEVVTSDVPAAGMPDPFEAFFAAQDEDDVAVLGNGGLQDDGTWREPDLAESRRALRIIYEVETKRAQEAKRTAAKKAAAARAQRHAQTVAGMVPAEQMAEIARKERQSKKMSWTIKMPEAGNSGQLIDAGLRIDGRLLHHGSEITGTVGEWESQRHIMWGADQNEQDFQGKRPLTRLRQTATGFITGKVPL